MALVVLLAIITIVLVIGKRGQDDADYETEVYVVDENAENPDVDVHVIPRSPLLDNTEDEAAGIEMTAIGSDEAAGIETTAAGSDNV